MFRFFGLFSSQVSPVNKRHIYIKKRKKRNMNTDEQRSNKKKSKYYSILHYITVYFKNSDFYLGVQINGQSS